MPKKEKSITLEIPELEYELITLHLLGETPLCFNSMAGKAMRELLLPAGRKSPSQKKTSLKHDPHAEFHASIYPIDDGPTLLGFPSPGLKKAIAAAALDVPGATKTAINRQARVSGRLISIYGVPQIWLTGVRTADIKHTPDVRSRAIVPQWAATVHISFVRPLLNVKAIANLVSAAGQIIGLGDGRQEKGAFDFGLFRLVADNDPAFKAVLETGGRDAQELAMKAPEAFDSTTTELLDWYDSELKQRGLA